MRVASLLQGVWEPGERRMLVSRLQVTPGQRVLEIAVGTGSNLTLIADEVGPNGRVAGLDLSSAMLRQCKRKFQRKPQPADLIEAEASQLPVAANTFDVVLHFGGFKDFGSKKKAVEEMMRVARPAGKIAISDRCVPPDKRNSLRGRLLLWLDPLLSTQPPLDLIPSSVNDLQRSWFWANTAYLIRFTKP
jgi:ubiquinone/menaquinone biosynthesis C-methylase UbiE